MNKRFLHKVNRYINIYGNNDSGRVKCKSKAMSVEEGIYAWKEIRKTKGNKKK